MKEKIFGFKIEIISSSVKNPKMKIYKNEDNVLWFKVLNEDDQEIEAILREIEGYYIGENNKNKVFLTQPINENRFVTNVDKELASFDIILVVDTSYDTLSKIAFTSIKIFAIQNTVNRSYAEIRSFLLEWDASLITKPENFMYCFAIEILRDHFKESQDTPKIAVVIDSDLENIPSYNARTNPIFNNYVLPEKYYIFYASSDRGNFLQNKMIRVCDKVAQNALKEYKKNSQ